MKEDIRDVCLKCGENKTYIRDTQRKGEGIICGLVDSETGELDQELGRHQFVMTKTLERAIKAEAEYWKRSDAVYGSPIKDHNDINRERPGRTKS